MPEYLYNNQRDAYGKHEVHISTCDHLPAIPNQVTLGWFATYEEAIAYAKSVTDETNFDGCHWCCSEHHTG